MFVLDGTNPNLRPVTPADGTTRASRIDPTIDAGNFTAGPPPPTSPPDTQPLAPPVEIGDFVWIDVNRDGLQSPGEPPIPRVTLRLYDCAGQLVGTTVTDGSGRYVFNDSNVTGGLLPDTSCYAIRIDDASDFGPGGPLNGFEPTRSRASSDSFTIDSDGVPFLGMIVTPATTPSPGGRDDSYDFGFFGREEVGGNPPAFTGVDSTGPLRLGLGLVGLGGILVLIAAELGDRRRRA